MSLFTREAKPTRPPTRAFDLLIGMMLAQAGRICQIKILEVGYFEAVGDYLIQNKRRYDYLRLFCILRLSASQAPKARTGNR